MTCNIIDSIPAKGTKLQTGPKAGYPTAFCAVYEKPIDGLPE